MPNPSGLTGRWISVCLLCLLLAGCQYAPVDTRQHITETTYHTDLTWETYPSLPMGVLGHRVTANRDALVVTGGFSGMGSTTNAIQVFDGNQWQLLELKLLTPRAMHAQIALADGRILLAGGLSGAGTSAQPLTSTEIIDFKAGPNGKVVSGPDLASPTRSPSGHRLPDGRVVIIGGQHATVIDPSVMNDTLKIELQEKRLDHASVLLDGNHIAVIAGRTPSIERLDIDSRQSTLLPDRLPLAIDDFRAARLTDGRVWILGGQDSDTGNTLEETWLLDPMQPGNLTRGPTLGLSAGIADACLVIADSRRAWLLGGESQASGKDDELQTVRMLDLERARIIRQTAMGHDHDDAAAAYWRGRLIILGGLSYLNLMGQTVPYPNDQVESAVIVDALTN
ncbi:hypothetical protein [Mucisphaera sp.]|uniref:hypothetical protein n=1 Tax=Mucisphaera sp. TaxID=2913024 RepID=UPI003D106CF1